MDSKFAYERTSKGGQKAGVVDFSGFKYQKFREKFILKYYGFRILLSAMKKN